MRVAAISDIHGNLPALKAVLTEIDKLKVDFIVCTGDIVGYGPWINECLALVQSRCRYVVKGNHEDGLLRMNDDFEDDEALKDSFNPEALAALRYASLRVNNGEIDWIRALPLIIECSELSMTLAHGSFVPPYFDDYVLTLDDAENQLKEIKTMFGVVGNSHLIGVFATGLPQYSSGTHIFEADERFIVNAGSVGQPRDGNPQASFAIIEKLDDGRHKVELRRINYDVEECAFQIVRENLPGWLAIRLTGGI